jgi:hypothetical protein
MASGVAQGEGPEFQPQNHTKKKKKKITHTQKRADGVDQGIGPEFKPQYHNK